MGSPARWLSADPGQDGIRVLHALTFMGILGVGEGVREGSEGPAKAPSIVLTYETRALRRVSQQSSPAGSSVGRRGPLGQVRCSPRPFGLSFGLFGLVFFFPWVQTKY